MSKEQLIADYKAKNDQALSELVDAAQAEVVPAPSPDIQAQIDAAVAAKAAADQVKIDSIQSELDAAVAADAADKAALQAKQDLLDKVKALLA